MSLANRTIGRFVLASAQRCVYYSPAALKYFQRSTRFRRHPVLIPNGVDTKTFRPLDETARCDLKKRLDWSCMRPQMLFVGRFVEKKGLRYIRNLAERFPECDWSLVGWGPDNPKEWGLPNVRCLGRLPQAEIVAYYQAADLLVLPSVGEGFPLVVQEAMACGTPALVSESTAAGSPDASSHLIVSKLTESALEAKLREVLPTLGDRRARVAVFARDHWDWEACVDRYVEILSELTPAGRTV
jgi:glycosyltransferase involved in cell wall biosynthesis